MDMQHILCLSLLLVNCHVLAKNLGESCSPPADGATDECTVGNSECQTDKCACKTGFIKEGVNCLKDLGAVCGNANECVSNADCDTTCKCETGYNPVSGLCQKVLGSTCTTANAATVCTVTDSECKGATCTCKDGHKEENDICKKKTPVSEVVCTAGGTECKDIAYSECDTTTGVFKCKCEKGYKVDTSDDSVCVKVLDSQCSGNVACPGLPNSICVSDKCVCSPDYGEMNNLCILTVSGTDCTDTGDECESIDNAICDAEGGKCKCSPGSTMNIDTCVPENGAATSRHKEATLLSISILVAIKMVFR